MLIDNGLSSSLSSIRYPTDELGMYVQYFAFYKCRRKKWEWETKSSTSQIFPSIIETGLCSSEMIMAFRFWEENEE